MAEKYSAVHGKRNRPTACLCLLLSKYSSSGRRLLPHVWLSQAPNTSSCQISVCS